MSSILYTDHVPAVEFLDLSQRVWPGAYGLGDVTLALSKTHNVGAWDERMLVGSVRVLTDGYFFATIPEIFVDQNYRCRGIGRELMRRALGLAPRGKLFFGVQPGAVGFYERIGCKPDLVAFVAEASQLTSMGSAAQ